MTNIQVITDSDSSLSPEIAAKYGIKLVPILIRFGEESYFTNYDIDDKVLFEKIDSINQLPTTDPPTSQAFAAAFNEALMNGATEILCICVGGQVSSTFESAQTAAREFPGRKIKVIDSKYMSVGQGFMAIAAAEAVASGATLDQAVELVESMLPNINTYAMLSTMKYLAMSGRVGKLVANITSVFDIHPVLTMKNGRLDLLERIRTRNAAMDRVVDLLVESIGNKEIKKVAFFHVNNMEDAIILKARLRERLALPEDSFIVDFTPGLSVHSGSGTIGASIYAI